MHEATWQSIERERLSLADLADELTDEQWETQSLCSEWRVRDVIAHLVMTPAGEPSPGQMVRALLRTRGDLWGAGRDVAIAYAARPTADLAAGLRTYAAVRTKPVFVNADNIVLDLLVHGQDITVPRHRPRGARGRRSRRSRALLDDGLAVLRPAPARWGPADRRGR